MADSTIPQTPITPNLNINLEPHTEATIPQISPITAPVEAKEDRLSQEDKLIEQQKKVEIPTPPVAPTVVAAPVVAPIPVVPVAPQITVPVVKPEITPIPVAQTALQKDLQIIQDLQKTPVTPATPKPAVTPQTPNTVPAANAFNLDSIAVNIPTVTAAATPTVAPKIPVNPYDQLQNIIPQIAPTGPAIQNTNPKQNQKQMIEVAITIGFIFLSWFVFKTMYPLQYDSVVASIMGNPQDTITTSLDATPISGDVIDTGLNSGNILLESGNNLLDSGVLDGTILTGLSAEILSGENHDAAADTGTSSLVPEISAPTMTMEEFTSKIQTYSTQGKLSTLKSKKSNNKELTQASLALYKRAEAVLQDIANGKEITTDNMNTIITELEGYLAKIEPKTNASAPTTEQTTPTPESPSTGFNPDSFFGTSGNSQN